MIALYEAKTGCVYWGEEMVRYLLGKGVKIPPVHLAAYFGELQKVQGLLADGADINSKDSAGFTPLHYALGRGHKKVVELLISKGADVNARTLHDQTPLMAAKSVDMTALLIANGADVNLNTKSGVPNSMTCTDFFSLEN